MSLEIFHSKFGKENIDVDLKRKESLFSSLVPAIEEVTLSHHRLFMTSAKSSLREPISILNICLHSKLNAP